MREPETPFDAAISKVEPRLADVHERLEEARRKRWKWRDEGEHLIADAERENREPDARSLDVFRARHAEAVEEFKRADRLRLRFKARLNSLQDARARWLLDQHGVFPELNSPYPRRRANGSAVPPKSGLSLRGKGDDAPERAGDRLARQVREALDGPLGDARERGLVDLTDESQGGPHAAELLRRSDLRSGEDR